MKLVRFLALGAAALSISACSTIIEGTSQEISIGTAPPEASCKLERDGVVIGLIPSTPGTAKIEKNKQNITITCEKEGYKDAVYNNKSDFAGATAGNILLGGIIGIGIDAATGAANKYENDVAIKLEPVETAPATDSLTPAVMPTDNTTKPSS